MIPYYLLLYMQLLTIPYYLLLYMQYSAGAGGQECGPLQVTRLAGGPRGVRAARRQCAARGAPELGVVWCGVVCGGVEAVWCGGAWVGCGVDCILTPNIRNTCASRAIVDFMYIRSPRIIPQIKVLLVSGLRVWRGTAADCGSEAFFYYVAGAFLGTTPR